MSCRRPERARALARLSRERLWPSALAFGAAAFAAPSEVQAQSWLAEGRVGLASGLEGGGGAPGVAWQRSRGQLWASLDGRVDERPKWGYGARAFVELERATGVGLELGWIYNLTGKLRLFAGTVGVVLPQSAVGVTLRGNYRLSLGEDLFLSPMLGLSALPLGEDIPAGSGLVWLTLGVGVELPL